MKNVFTRNDLPRGNLDVLQTDLQATVERFCARVSRAKLESALAALGHSENPWREPEVTKAVVDGVAGLSEAVGVIADFLSRHRLDVDDVEAPEVANINRAERRRRDAVDRSLKWEMLATIRRSAPAVLDGLAAVTPSADEVGLAVETLVSGPSPWDDQETRAELSRYAARLACANELLTQFLEGADLLDPRVYDATLQDLRGDAA